MTPGSEVPANSSNIQEIVLSHARRERLTVTIHMMDGTEMEGRIKSFDRNSLVLEHGGSDYMIFTHAIAAICTPRPISNYPASQ